MQREKQLLKAQLTQLGVHLEQMRAEVTNATEERSALRAQLRDFVVSIYVVSAYISKCCMCFKFWEAVVSCFAISRVSH